MAGRGKAPLSADPYFFFFTVHGSACADLPTGCGAADGEGDPLSHAYVNRSQP